MDDAPSAGHATAAPQEREKERTSGRGAGSFATQNLRQQASNTRDVLLQPSNPKAMPDICLQVDLGLLAVPPATNRLSLLSYIVVVPLQLFRC